MIKLVIYGQVTGGKNNRPFNHKIKKYIPSKRFEAWRHDALFQIRKQIKKVEPIQAPVHVEMDYYAGDLRRRDLPMLLDAVWHVLERADIIADDSQLAGHGRGMKFFNHGRSGRPRVELKLWEEKEIQCDK